ncbi:hypothetical protein KBY96_10085 [Cyanobium sp. ATX 6A2]|uniref:hypothetical protein n=1 Tax=Cyanobium sp. ATX 6A2 TaxID=2823700 RepID=UPI0020CC78E5|nr:hypothetical protein [Cyanobium sp. ATX 6A2]MCP9888273.1 hypothetical protein [Cyanobium sp. ATX 6A2]
MDSSIDQLCAAVSEEIGMPVGRVRRVVLAVERQRLRATGANTDPVVVQPAAQPKNSLGWYPLGANGRLRPAVPEQP